MPVFAFFLMLPLSGLTAEGGEEIQQDRFTDIREISVSAPDWDILLGPSSRDARVRLSDYQSRDYRIDIAQTGDRLTIEIHQKRAFRIFSTGQPKLSVTVPENAMLEISTASGDIRLQEVITGELRVSSASGDMEGRGISGSLEFSSASGDLNLGGMQGDISAKTSSGDIQIRRVEGLMSFQSSSGEITIGEATGGLEAKTSSGDIRFENLSIFQGARFASVSGDIELDVLGTLSEYSIECKSTSGDIRVFDYRTEDRLNAGDGDVPLTAATTSGDISIY